MGIHPQRRNQIPSPMSSTAKTIHQKAGGSSRASMMTIPATTANLPQIHFPPPRLRMTTASRKTFFQSMREAAFL